jgi:hypothetical protein
MTETRVRLKPGIVRTRAAIARLQERANQMPEDKKPEPMVVSEREAQQERARRVAREQDAEPEREMPIDEASDGGRFIVDGETVDAEGKPIKKDKD